jgi:hypothetical protein
MVSSLKVFAKAMNSSFCCTVWKTGHKVCGISALGTPQGILLLEGAGSPKSYTLSIMVN